MLNSFFFFAHFTARPSKFELPALPAYSMINWRVCEDAPVVQRIELRRPKARMGVQFFPGAQLKNDLDSRFAWVPEAGSAHGHL